MTLLTDLAAWFDDVKAEFILNFIDKNRWRMLLTGLGNTLLIALLACLIGIVLGVVVAILAINYDVSALTMISQTIDEMLSTYDKAQKEPERLVFAFFNRLCLIYTTIIRGTPMVIQLLIMYYIIFATSDNGVMVATLAFGINSGAYVSEIFRSGIMSIDKGQMEAGRSLGLNYLKTMWFVIAPQVLKNVLPTLANEFITLLKETSVAGYVAVSDLTFAGNRIRGVTYSPFMPLIAVAIIYLILVMFLTRMVGKLERRLRQGDNR